MLTACLSMMLHLLLLLIRIAMKLRLSIPLVYLVLMLTVFQPWYRVHGTGGWDFSGDAGLRDAVMDHLPRSICKARAGLMPALVFLRRTVGRCGVCVVQTCTDARSAHKTAHIGTTRPTPRSKRLRRCAFSDLCRSSAVNLPSGGGIGVRVFPASCVLVPKRDACAFLARQEKPKTQPDPRSV